MIARAGSMIRDWRREPIDADWKTVLWDPYRWEPRAVAARIMGWVRATRRRRWAASITAILFVLYIFPGPLAAIAFGQSGTVGTGSVTSALGFMHIQDIDGVDVSKYTFITDHGSVLHMDKALIALPIMLVYALWWIGSETAIYLLGYGMSFQWLNFVATPMRGVAHALTGQLPVALITATAVTVGSIFVAYFFARGFLARAVTQILFMMIVALLAPMILGDPLGDDLQMLAKGRDVGVSVAAGLNGIDDPDPTQQVENVQEIAATYKIRYVLQMWNFGHVIDSSPGCRAVWTAGMAAGNENQVKDGLRICGDAAAYNAASNPSVGQIATGLALLLAMLIDLIFSLYCMIAIVGAGLNTLYWGFAAILSVISGAYVVGPTQTFAIRSIFHGFFSAGYMVGSVIFVGAYELFMGDLYQQAQGNAMQISFVAAIVELVTLIQFRRFKRSWQSGDHWAVNRVALTAQNGLNFVYGSTGALGSGAGGGSALGMGMAGANGHGVGVLTTLAAMATVNNSPLTSWLGGATPNRLQPHSGLQRDMMLAQGAVWTRKGLGGKNGIYVQSLLPREMYLRFAQGVRKAYGRGSMRGITEAIGGVIQLKGTPGDAYAAIVGAGYRNARKNAAGIEAWKRVLATEEDETLKYGPLGRVAAAYKAAEASVYDYMDGNGDPLLVAAHIGALESAVRNYSRSGKGYDFELNEIQGRAVNRYLDNPNKKYITDLQDLIAGKDVDDDEFELMALDGDPRVRKTLAEGIYDAIGGEYLRRIEKGTLLLSENPRNQRAWWELSNILSAAQDTDSFVSGTQRIPYHSALIRDTDRAEDPRWGRALGEVADRFD